MKLPKVQNSFDPIQKAEIPAGFDFKTGVHRAGDCIKEMLHTFKHGKPRGETTHIKEIDEHFRWKQGFLYCGTGYPANGKTEGTRYLTLIKSVMAGKSWSFYSPEDFYTMEAPGVQFFDNLVQTYIGQSVDPHYSYNQMPEAEYKRAIDFIHEYFNYIYYPGMQHTPEFLREVAAYEHAEKGIYGFIKDPWNKLIHKKGKLRDDEYLELQLPQEQKQARELNIIQLINVHPVRIPREQGKPWPVPDQQHIAGGQMWDNMSDVIFAWHRPNFYKDKADTLTEFHIHKVKQQHLMGTPGRVEMDFSRSQSRYLINGKSPLEAFKVPNTPDPIKAEPASHYEINNLPDSNFEEYAEHTPPF